MFCPETPLILQGVAWVLLLNWLNTNSVEDHTTLSAHPFRVELEPGSYTFTVERGKEYRPLVRRVQIGTEPVKVRLPLHRWGSIRRVQDQIERGRGVLPPEAIAEYRQALETYERIARNAEP